MQNLEDHAKEIDMDDPFAEIRANYDISSSVDSLIGLTEHTNIETINSHPVGHYFDGNSLGPLSKHALSHALIELIRWGNNRIDGWESWVGLAQRLGNKVAKLSGFKEGEVIVTDNVSSNIYKLVEAFIGIDYTRLVTNPENFPTDRYILQGIEHKWRSQGVDVECINLDSSSGETGISPKHLDRVLRGLDERAIVLYSAVDFKTGHRVDSQALKAVADTYDAVLIKDRCHSFGAFDEREDRGIPFVTCLYKYANSGPGGPAAIGIPEEYLDNPQFSSPIWAWWTHKNMFGFEAGYEANKDIGRFVSGTPPIISMAMAEAGLDHLLSAGIDTIDDRRVVLTDYLIRVYDELLSDYMELATPRDSNLRGSHIALKHTNAREISVALKNHGVVPDSRDDILRLAVTPLYMRAQDILSGMRVLQEVMRTEEYKTVSVDGFVP